MEKDTIELWCEHEFIVRTNGRSGSETHCISVFGDSERFEDIVTDDADTHVVKTVTARANERDEVEYNKFGHVVITRHIGPGELGTVRIQEASHGSMRTERVTIRTVDGRKVNLLEKLFANGSLQSESETHYLPDGNPSLSVCSNFAVDGRVVRHEQIVWHSENNPAITETTEFDWYGCPETYVKTLHNLHGAPLWQERLSYPDNSAKPSKKEVFIFNPRGESHSERSAVKTCAEAIPAGAGLQHSSASRNE